MSKPKTKHTPGPWEVDWEVDETGPRIFPKKQNASSVCRVDRYRDPKTEAELPWVKANAKLIAAAPELLETLQIVQAELKDGAFPCDDPKCPCEGNMYMELIKKVLAKVTEAGE